MVDAMKALALLLGIPALLLVYLYVPSLKPFMFFGAVMAVPIGAIVYDEIRDRRRGLRSRTPRAHN